MGRGSRRRGLATDLARDPTLAKAFRDRFILPRRRSVAEAIERAVQRGDLPAEVDEDLLIDLLLAAAVSLHFLYYNFARPHQSLRNPYPRTPAMAAGISDHVWKIEEIVGLLS
jgi:transposase InsO family protein